jgi:hypothetical protein
MLESIVSISEIACQDGYSMFYHMDWHESASLQCSWKCNVSHGYGGATICSRLLDCLPIMHNVCTLLPPAHEKIVLDGVAHTITMKIRLIKGVLRIPAWNPI